MSAAAEPLHSASVAQLRDWTESNRQWLIAAISRLSERLATLGEEKRGAWDDCVAATKAHGFTPALVHYACAFDLSAFERELLLLMVGLELDEQLRATVAALHAGAGARASFSFALAALAEPHWDAMSPDAPLRRWGMIELEPGAVLAQAALHIDERVLHYIAGIGASDARIVGIAALIAPTEANYAGADLPLARRISEHLAADPERSPIVALHSAERDALAANELAFAALALAGRKALWIAARDLPNDGGAQALLARHVDREALLSGAIPVLSIEGEGSEAAATSFAARLAGTLIWLGTPGHGLTSLPQSRRVLRFELRAADEERTRAALQTRWRHMAPEIEDDRVVAELDRAASQFRLGPAALESLFEQLQPLAPAERASAIWPAAREAARGGLDAIAQRIETRVDFSDLVLPAGQSAMLREIARQLCHRELVYREWGFGAKHRRGQGLVALFAGESGTGKTLAAEAIANEVGLDLYRIDLATLVSKYIGETEKNLKRLFEAAETSGAVLLFDEADALFGKRSEVKDSHDRYANIEIAYLLQQVEAYRGLAILTTNMRGALDRAFLRRIRFIVTFPFPDAEAREEIWRRQFSPNAPLGEVDWPALARLNLSGGNIRGIAVNAAFKAADAGRAIDQALLMTAAGEEFAKLERSFGAAVRG